MTRIIFPQTVYCWGSQCCLKCVRLGWGAVSASQSLSPVSQFVSYLALSFTLAGVLCPPRWACLRSCLPICLPISLRPEFVFDLPIWLCLPVFSPHLFPFWLCLSPWLGAVSASLGLSPVLSPNLSPTWLCLSPWLGCCVRLAGLVSQFASQFVSHLALSQFFLPICSPSGFVFHLGWGAVSQFVSQFVSHQLCLSPWLGCCVLLLVTTTYLPTYLPAYLPTYLPSYLHLPTYLLLLRLLLLLLLLLNVFSAFSCTFNVVFDLLCFLRFLKVFTVAFLDRGPQWGTMGDDGRKREMGQH